MKELNGWITKKVLIEKTGATPSQIQRWHREILAYSNQSLFQRVGAGRGSVTLYHPLAIPIAQRFLEIKELGRRDFLFWRWQL